MREFDGIAASNKFQMRSLYEFLAESDVAFEKPEVRISLSVLVIYHLVYLYMKIR